MGLLYLQIFDVFLYLHFTRHPNFWGIGIIFEIVLSVATITHNKCHWSWKGRKVERLAHGGGGDCSLMCCTVHLLQ